MDPQRFREAYQRFQLLDDKTYKLRNRDRLSLGPPTTQQMEEKLRDLCEYTLELKTILQELFLSIAGKQGESGPVSGGE
jgi:hypothetical protein